jgi:ERF superfamily protein
VHRSSASIGTLAAALAKAQAQLINPEKSMVATIRPDGSGKGEQIFRYAPLSSGLDIVRKTLGQHEIATVQTTAVDQTAGIVNLTTMLAHSSGEWITSDWPVCEIAYMATPQRMGAALTYARRYALFTLVGIAGEDDLDAPDLARQTSGTSGIEKQTRKEHGRLNGWGRHNSAPRTIRRDAKVRSNSAARALGPETSAELRDSLVAELSHLGCADDAATWAQRSLPEKNRLTAPDAQRVDEAFTAKLASFVASAADPSNTPEQIDQPSTPRPRDPNGLEKRSRSNLIDKGALALPEPRRIRDRDHVRYVAKQPCLICARHPSDAHHLRFAQNRALGRKVSDEFTVPMCRGHHRELHRSGDEVAWWRRTGIDPNVAARALWLETHPLSA